MNTPAHPKVSVIIPVYNPGEGVHRCIESLRAQLLDGLEFVFVDDRSEDGAMEAVRTWAEEDGRVRVLKNGVNLGAGPSRNRGIEAARGDYLSFVDPDDYVSPDFYELLYAAATAGGGHDIAKGLHPKVAEAGGQIGPADAGLNGRIRKRLSEGRPLYTAFTYEHQSAIYKSSLFDDGEARYGSTRTTQDMTFLLRVCHRTDDIVLEPRARYFYVQREGSAMHGDGLARSLEEVRAFCEQEDFLIAKGLDEEAKGQLAWYAANYFNRFQELLGQGKVGREDYRQFADELREAMRRVPDAEEAFTSRPQLAEILAGCPLTTPGLRRPGEGDVRVSVVVPVHDAEPYIGRCIESLRKQLLDGLEFVFVDDRSTDGSMAAVEAWAAEDPRVRVLVNEQNLGEGPSRNRGIGAARGDYFATADPDDWVSPDFYELLYAAATAGGGHDIAKGLRPKADEEGRQIGSVDASLNKRIERYLSEGKPLYGAFTYEHQTAIFRRRLFDGGARYGSTANACDVTFLLSACYNTRDIVLEPRACYYYVQREGSAVHRDGLARTLEEIAALSERVDFLRAVPVDEYSCNYLKTQIDVLLRKAYLASHNTDMKHELTAALAHEVPNIMNGYPGGQDILRDSPYHQALVNGGVLLPSPTELPHNLKLEGTLDWIGYVADHPAEADAYLGGCTTSIASTLVSGAKNGGRRGLEKAFAAIRTELKRVPLKQRTAIGLRVVRRLATRGNLRSALGTIKRKLLE